MQEQDLFDGKYRILKTLGKGGTSTVYLAENVRLGTLWAIKEIALNQGEAVHFLTEPHVLKNLRHSALPRIFDIIENDFFLYLIQDYIEGTPLDIVIQEEGAIPEKKLLDWAIDLCNVYEYLHGQQPHPIIYRDMKPSNLIVDQEGKIKLIDFGIAREFKSESASDTVCLGTRGYAAPEQYGTSQTDARSDLYSLGVTLYHALTGAGPNDPPYELVSLAETTGPWSLALGRVIDKAVKADPIQRYQTATEMRQALERIKEPPEAQIKIKPSLQPQFVGPVIIGVGGADARCGTTYHAVMIANHLARTRRKNVALVEYNLNPCFASMSPVTGGGPFEDNGVVYYPGDIANYKNGLSFSELREYKYIVLDLGQLKPVESGIMTPGLSYLEMTRVHCPILVASGALWRMSGLIAFNYCQENLDTWNVMITPTSKEMYRQIGPAVSQYLNVKRLYHSNFEPDPFRIGKLQEELIEKVIDEVAPTRSKGLFGFLGK